MKTSTIGRARGRSAARGRSRPGVAALAALTLAAGLSACGTTGESSEPKTVTTTESSADDSATTSVEEEAASEGAATETADEAEVEDETSDGEEGGGVGDRSVAFGETYEWLDGVSAKVSAPEDYQPDEYAFGGEDYDHHIRVTVTMTNDSDQVVDASFVSPTVTSGQRAGDEI